MSFTEVSKPTDSLITKHNTLCNPIMRWEWITPPNDDCKRCTRCGIIVNVEHPMEWQNDLEAW